jgi:predicted lipoprotein with Yx(FWY)xxD motif
MDDDRDDTLGGFSRAQRRAGVMACALALSLVTLAGWAGVARAAGPAPATGTVVSAASSPEGQVLVVGSGPQQNFAVYDLTSDAPPKFACSTTPFQLLGMTIPCTGSQNDALAEWPALTTVGRPIAGPGVRHALLGTVKRADLNAEQVTYAGHPLYLFDSTALSFTGNAVDEPAFPPWHGVWYLVSPKTGLAATNARTVTTSTIGSRQVLAGVMYTIAGGAPGPQPFPVYTYSLDRAGRSVCQRVCSVEFPPLLTTGPPQVPAGSSLDPRSLGVIVRSDGTHQVTYRGKPLYLDGTEQLSVSGSTIGFSGSGDGIKPSVHPAGTFSLVSPS